MSHWQAHHQPLGRPKWQRCWHTAGLRRCGWRLLPVRRLLTCNCRPLLARPCLQDALESIVEMREHDVPYHVRFAIDTDTRCGHWFTVKAKVGPRRAAARAASPPRCLLCLGRAAQVPTLRLCLSANAWVHGLRCRLRGNQSSSKKKWHPPFPLRSSAHHPSDCRVARWRWSAAPTCCSAQSLASAPLTLRPPSCRCSSPTPNTTRWGACATLCRAVLRHAVLAVLCCVGPRAVFTVLRSCPCRAVVGQRQRW